MKQRIGYLDFLRGIAIITVVMGHIIQSNMRGAAADNCFNFIYSFHMGFFFFISGCAAALSFHKNNWSNFPAYLKKKTIQLLVPFVVWGGLVFLILNRISILELPSKLLSMLKYPSEDAPWFIFELFFIQLIYFISCAICSKSKDNYTLPSVLIVAVVFVSGIILLKMKYYGSGYTWVEPQYFLIFVIGHMAQTLEWKPKYIKPLILLSFLLFIITVPLFDFNAEGVIKKTVIKTITSVSFSMMAYLLIREQYNSIKGRVSTFVNYLGTHTLEIYLTHSCLVGFYSFQWINTINMNAIPLFVTVFLIAIPISVLTIKISDIIKKIPLMPLFLYGKIQ